MIVRFLLALVSFCCAPWVLAQDETQRPMAHPFLWRIEGKVPSYLYGTIHLPDPRVVALHEAVIQAMELADAIYTEIPLDAVSMAKVAFKTFLPKDETLDDLLPRSLYERVDEYLQKKGLSLEPFKRFKIWVLTQTLTQLDMMDDLADLQALDMQIYQFGREHEKEVGGVETVQEQVDVFDNMSLEEQIKNLEQTLDQLEEAEVGGVDLIEALILAYLTGNTETLIQKMNEEIDPNDPVEQKFMKALLLDRNVRMADRIVEKLEKNPDRSYFFAFGAAHFSGPGSVNEFLQKKGLKVTRMLPPPATSKKPRRAYEPQPVP